MSYPYTEENSWLYHEGGLYDLSRLFPLLEGKEAGEVEVTDLLWCLTPDPEEARVKGADLSAPLMVVRIQERILLVDGNHRTHKALSQGVKSLPALFLAEEEFESARRQ